MGVLLQQLLNGITIGSVYSLVALGLTLVFGILHVPNFAHGAFYMILCNIRAGGSNEESRHHNRCKSHHVSYG
jgi:hypothetical protein